MIRYSSHDLLIIDTQVIVYDMEPGIENPDTIW